MTLALSFLLIHNGRHPMRYLDFSHPDPAMNLAIEETLLDEVESNALPPLLRVWESPSYFIVLGYSSKVREDVREENCRRDGIPVLRRVSGGGTVLQGPGCLNYTLIEPIDPVHDDLRCTTHRVLSRVLHGFDELPMQIAGLSDIVYEGKKCMGHAERRKRKTRLFHGSILYDFNLELLEKYLSIPPRQPAYRQNRPHRDFVRNLPLSVSEIKVRLYTAFGCRESLQEIPLDIANTLQKKYTDLAFIHRL